MSRILIVDDDEDLQAFLELALRSEGYVVTMAESVSEASSLLDAQWFDLALVDVRLPDGSGISIADRAVELGTRALLITGYGFQVPPAGMRRHHYLLKPVSVEELRDAVA